MSRGDGWLIDKFALARLRARLDRGGSGRLFRQGARLQRTERSWCRKSRTQRGPDAWLNRIERGLVKVAAPTVLEIGYSARSASDWHDLLERSPVAMMSIVAATPRIEHRAIEVQGILASRGEHRAPSVVDLLVAATAEVAKLTILHVDKDFDLIAEVTGQPVERPCTDISP